jgi:hypothetical protein
MLEWEPQMFFARGEKTWTDVRKCRVCGKVERKFGKGHYAESGLGEECHP